MYGLTNSGAVRGSVTIVLGSSDIALLSNSEFLTYYPSNNPSPDILGGYTDFSGRDGQNAAGNELCGASGACFSGGLVGPTALAVDSNAHVWALDNTGQLSGFDTTGALNGNGGSLPGSPFSGGGLNTTAKSPNQPYPWLAIDGGENIWVANYTGSVSEFNSAGTPLTPNYASATQPGGLYSSFPSCLGQGLAIDGSGNVWVSCNSSTTPVLEYIGLAVPVTTPLLPGNFGVKP